VLVLCNEQDAPELIVCAVPYLRDRDIRVAEAGESVEDKERKLIEGIRTHYAAVAAWPSRSARNSGSIFPSLARDICSPQVDKPSMVMACANSMSAPWLT